MLIRSILIPFISLAIVLAVNGAPTPISPRPHENARSAVDFLEDREISNVSNDNNLLRQNTVRSQLSNGLMERSGIPWRGLEARRQKHPNTNTIVVPGKGKNYAKNQRKARKKAKAKLAHLAGAKDSPSIASAESVHAHPTVALKEGEHVQEVKKEEPKPLTPEHKVETVAEKEAEKKEEAKPLTPEHKVETAAEKEAEKKEEAKPLTPEHKEETPAEKKEDLYHGGSTEGELPQPQTGASGADLATAATAAVGSLAQLAPMIMQGMAAGGSAGVSSAVANDVMGGGASSGSGSGQSPSSAKSGATGDSAPPSDNASSSTSSNSSGDSSSPATSNPDKADTSDKADTGDGKGDDASTNKDDADKEKDEKKDGEKGSDEDGKVDSNKKNSDADSGNGSGEEHVNGTKNATSTDGAGMRKRGTERYLRQIMSLD
ncbi:hypothetical protein DFH05DRAFT_1528519 [Lentinula detonsa]|uniref:Uncharacterized protein n=1 Tax=Lentinula detonsa TaxID=2804962 RepID=A0A9W8TU28_9AGAR|nr:hypothetical protein DFH05DRAFT_1528519 [Lentinula detonsa]